MDDELGAAPRRILQEGRCDGVILGRPRADDDDAVAVLGRGERAVTGRVVEPFHQGRDRRGVAQACCSWSPLLVVKPCRMNFWKR